MRQCAGCQLPVVDPEEPARYDVFRDPDESSGPYCATCFDLTVTGEYLRALSGR